MRKLCLTLATGAALLATGTLSQPASAMTPAAGLRAASVVDNVSLACTHFWNGRWHHRQHCFWSGYGHYRHHHHHRHHHR
jgi:hypothetical protein